MASKPYRSKPGPDELPPEKRRVLVTLSISNKEYPRLERLRRMTALREGHELSDEEISELVKQLSYQAIDAYCEGVERNEGAIFA